MIVGTALNLFLDFVGFAGIGKSGLNFSSRFVGDEIL